MEDLMHNRSARGVAWLRFLLVALAVPAFSFVALSRAAENPASPPGTCMTNEQCVKGEFCSKLFGSCAESGKCEERPADCTEHGHSIVKPVCGCDDKSYDNFCLAAAAGVNVKHEGKCAAGPTP
jgi:hypothetical protein